MNTILLPTDFSPSAVNAAHFAAHLAQQIQGKLLLVHIYQIPVTMNDMPVMVLSADELRDSANEQLLRTGAELKAQYPELVINTESRLGTVNDELEDICKELQPSLIVLGSHGMSGFERMLFGSTTASVMRHIHTPVIAVPTDYTKRRVNKAALAADLLDVKKIPAQKITSITQLLGVQLELVHVASRNDRSDFNMQPLLEQLQPLHPQHHVVQHENVKDGLLQYLEQSDVDMLIVLPHEHSLVERLFFKLHTDDIVQHAPVPVMTIR